MCFAHVRLLNFEPAVAQWDTVMAESSYAEKTTVQKSGPNCVLRRTETGSEDTFSVCCCSDGRLISGHNSVVKMWSASGDTLLHTIATATSGDITCICQAPFDEHQFAVSVSTTVLLYDNRNLAAPVEQYQYNEEEINEISLHQKGYISACDDAGEIKIIDTENHRLFKTLSGPHSNICATAKFLPKRPWELVSGGMDCKVVRWDFSRPRPIAEITAHSDSEQLGGMMVNPPMVHNLDTWTTNHCIVCGLGNGEVVVYDVRDKGIELKCSSPLHSAMIARVCCVEKVEGEIKRYYVVSGGNDCKIVISEMIQKEPLPSRSKKGRPTPAVLKTIAEIQHCSKVNWLSVNSLGTEVSVADQTPFVSVYKLFDHS